MAFLLFAQLGGLGMLFAKQRGLSSGSLSSTAARFLNSEALMLLAVVGFLAAAFVSGLWLLRMDPRGRRLTIALACIAFPCQGAYMLKTLLDSGASAAMYPLHTVAAYWGELAVMAYCLFNVIVMSLPSVRRAYTRAGHVAEESS